MKRKRSAASIAKQKATLQRNKVLMKYSVPTADELRVMKVGTGGGGGSSGYDCGPLTVTVGAREIESVLLTTMFSDGTIKTQKVA